MSKQLNRRDFLKLVSMTSGSLLLSRLARPIFDVHAQGSQTLPNIVIFVFDAMSARNLSLLGYPRQTTPNLEKFAEHATVYHAHQSGGNFTTPGTASLLTGMYPWTHRAFNQAGLVARPLAERNIFTLMGSNYHRMAYSQNMWPNYLFEQFISGIDTILPPGTFSAVEQIIGARFPKHRGETYRAYEEFLFQGGTPPPSLVLGLLSRLYLLRQSIFAQTDEYKRGIPRTGNDAIYFRLNEVFDGLLATIPKLSPPYFGYFHLWAPHAPYRPTESFEGMFNDNWKPVKKPKHPLGGDVPYSQLNARRANYDSYVANVDAEFGRMIEALTNQGALENTYVVVTADHGESFERGVDGHTTPLLFQPLTNIPLLIAAPGQTARQDIYTPTSCVDVLPTLLTLASQPVPEWCEGTLLPGLGGTPDPERSLFTVEAASNPAFSPLKIATVAMRKNQYKLIYYTGYKSGDSFELYDLENDPEELLDLYRTQTELASSLSGELLAKLDSVNQKYQR